MKFHLLIIFKHDENFQIKEKKETILWNLINRANWKQNEKEKGPKNFPKQDGKKGIQFGREKQFPRSRGRVLIASVNKLYEAGRGAALPR